jgi:hypothetical protein
MSLMGAGTGKEMGRRGRPEAEAGAPPLRKPSALSELLRFVGWVPLAQHVLRGDPTVRMVLGVRGFTRMPLNER